MVVAPTDTTDTSTSMPPHGTCDGTANINVEPVERPLDCGKDKLEAFYVKMGLLLEELGAILELVLDRPQFKTALDPTDLAGPESSLGIPEQADDLTANADDRPISVTSGGSPHGVTSGGPPHGVTVVGKQTSSQSVSVEQLRHDTPAVIVDLAIPVGPGRGVIVNYKGKDVALDDLHNMLRAVDPWLGADHAMVLGYRDAIDSVHRQCASMLWDQIREKLHLSQQLNAMERLFEWYEILHTYA